MITGLLITFIAALGINILMFLPAYFFRTDKLTDISYAITFVIVASYGLFVSKINLFSLVLWLMIFFWAARLGSYLLIRIHKIKKDDRFDGRRENFWNFLKFWILQGTTVFVVLLPSSLFFINRVSILSNYAFIGVLIWIIGLIIETISDLQKYRFINNPKNKGKWIDKGLWKYSRHPNYFGEITLWIGVYIYTLFGLNTIQSIVGAIGPLYIASLIIFVSGLPMLEKKADARWGNDKNYQKYKSKTSILIPLPQKK
jgi:steroid 5-alpha reductase family enzyme